MGKLVSEKQFPIFTIPKRTFTIILNRQALHTQLQYQYFKSQCLNNVRKHFKDVNIQLQMQLYLAEKMESLVLGFSDEPYVTNGADVSEQ